MTCTALREILDKGFVELPYPDVNARLHALYAQAREELAALEEAGRTLADVRAALVERGAKREFLAAEKRDGHAAT